MKIVAITQARMGSTRLPGKIMADLAGEPMLVRHVNRVRRARTLDGVVVATTDRPEDDVVADLCHDRGWNVFRGSESDLLDRYYRAAKSVQADIVVRVTSDCPLIDPSIIDQAVEKFLNGQPEVQYLSNNFPRQTFPRGLDTEVIRYDALERAWQEDTNPQWREHVTPYVYKNPSRFRMSGLTCEADNSHLRWTVDTPEDLEFVRKIYGHFGHDRFTWREVRCLLEQHSDWIEINRHVRQKVV